MSVFELEHVATRPASGMEAPRIVRRAVSYHLRPPVSRTGSPAWLDSAFLMLPDPFMPSRCWGVLGLRCQGHDPDSPDQQCMSYADADGLCFACRFIRLNGEITAVAMLATSERVA